MTICKNCKSEYDPNLSHNIHRSNGFCCENCFIEFVLKKLETAKGCMNFKGFVCKKTNCELTLCPLNKKFGAYNPDNTKGNKEKIPRKDEVTP